jgi:hypothetical protein
MMVTATRPEDHSLSAPGIACHCQERSGPRA